MSKLLPRIEAAFSDKNFPLYVLAVVGVLAMPPKWFGTVVLLILPATAYSYLRRNPGTLTDKNWHNRPEIHRFAILLVAWFWWWLLTSAQQSQFCGLSAAAYGSPGLVALLFVPMIVYSCMAVVVAAKYHRVIRRKSADKASNQNLIAQQKWTNFSCVGFTFAFVLSALGFAFAPGGAGTWLSNWLISSGLDARLSAMGGFIVKQIQIYPVTAKFGVPATFLGQSVKTVVLQPEAELFAILVKFLLAFAIGSMLWRPAVRLAGFLTALLKDMNCRLSEETLEIFTRTLRMPKTCIKLKERHQFFKNVAASFWWLLICYALLFALFGFSTGPLGKTIVGWLDCCIADANTGMIYGASANHSLRLFCAAIIALYGTVPLAVTGAVFLPYLRKRQLILNKHGVFLPDGPYFSLRFCPMRLWSDFARIELREAPKRLGDEHSSLIIRFHSGGKLSLKISQIGRNDLEKFLATLDENALDCTVSDQVLSLRSRLRCQSSDSRQAFEHGALPAQQFQSTIFVPHEPGSWLPNGEMRVVRLLASRPLSCVYLVRTEAGQLAIAKQFFLSDDNEQTQALRKCFEREYEMLSKLDHQAVSKVLNVFHKEQSTYLVIEHATGTDLRTMVSESGPASEDKVIGWALQLCEIMIYLHSQDPPVVHRDLTPDNVVVAADGSVRIIDFGAAHQFLEGITGTIIGKQCYISAEQLRGQAGPQSDVYSFGCMIYFLLTGEEPTALTQCNTVGKADVTDPLNALILSCTEFSPEARPQSFHDLKERLQLIKAAPVKEVLSRLKAVADSQGIPMEPGSSQPQASNIANIAENICQMAELTDEQTPTTTDATSLSGSVIYLDDHREPAQVLHLSDPEGQSKTQ